MRIKYSSVQRGQVLLIVILIMVVSLTVGLSLVTRTITNTRLANDAENSKRAFSAAEAGLQEALRGSTGSLLPLQSTLGNNSQYKNVTIASVSGTSFFMNNGATVPQDDGSDIWLVPHSPDGTPNLVHDLTQPQSQWVAIYFGNTRTACTDSTKEPALEVVLIAGPNVAQSTSTHYLYDPCSSRSDANHMKADNQTGRMGVYTSPAGGWPVYNTASNTITYFDYAVAMPVTDGYFMRVVPLYTNSIILVGASVSLPSQGDSISSTGVYGSTQRKLTAFRSYAKLPPEFFPNIIFSSQ